MRFRLQPTFPTLNNAIRELAQSKSFAAVRCRCGALHILQMSVSLECGECGMVFEAVLISRLPEDT